MLHNTGLVQQSYKINIMHMWKRQKYLQWSGELKRQPLASQTRGRGTPTAQPPPQRSSVASFLSLRLSAAAWCVLQSGALNTKRRWGRHRWRHVSHTEWLIAAAAATDSSREGNKTAENSKSPGAHKVQNLSSQVRLYLFKRKLLSVLSLLTNSQWDTQLPFQIHLTKAYWQFMTRSAAIVYTQTNITNNLPVMFPTCNVHWPQKLAYILDILWSMKVNTKAFQ